MKLQKVQDSTPKDDPMSCLSTELDAIKEEMEINQAEIAKRTKLTTTSVSRYCNGEPADKEAVLALCKTFPKYCSRLAAAWIRDNTPDEIAGHVRILLDDGTLPPSLAITSPPWENLPPKARKLLEQAAKAVRERPNFAKKLQAILEP